MHPCLHIMYGCFPITPELRSWNRDSRSAKPKVLAFGPLQTNFVAIPTVVYGPAHASPGACKKGRLWDLTPGFLNQNLHFNKTPRWFMCILKLEKHWPRGLFQNIQVLDYNLDTDSLLQTHPCPYRTSPQESHYHHRVEGEIKYKLSSVIWISKNNKYFFSKSMYQVFHGIYV